MSPDEAIDRLYAAASGEAAWSTALDALAAHAAARWAWAHVHLDGGSAEEHFGGASPPASAPAWARACAEGTPSPDALLLEGDGSRVCLALAPGGSAGRWAGVAAALGSLPRVAAHARGAIAERHAHHGILDALDVGVVFVDRFARIHHRNPAAARLLEAGRGLTARGGVLDASLPEARTALHAAIQEATAPGADRARATGPVAIHRSAPDPPIALMVVPVGRSEGATPLEMAALLVTDPEGRGHLRARDVAALAGVSPAEARVAAALAEGLTLAETARVAGVSVETVRKQLRALLLKTGTGRQSAAVAGLLHARPPLE